MPRAVRGRPLEGDPAVFRALADATRRRILAVLGERELRVADIAEHFEISRPAVSKHLRVLREAGLVRARKVGREQRYAIVPGPLREAAAHVRDLDAFWSARIEALGKHLGRR